MIFRTQHMLVGLLGALLVALPARAESQELDKGHRLMVENGLHILALAFHDCALDTKRLKDAGFTGVMWPWASDMSRVGPPPGVPWCRWATSEDEVTLPPGEAEYRSSMLAFQLKDEQDINSSEVREKAAKWFESARPKFPDVILYTNQYGGQVTNENMFKYWEACRPDMLSFDTYPWRLQPWPGGSPTPFYGDAQRYRKLALGWGVPYAMYVQTFQGENLYREPSESEMRLNWFAAWTFGYKMVTAFLYNSGATTLFKGPGDGKPVAGYGWARKINRESRNIGPALVRLRSTDVRIVLGQHQDGDGNAATIPRPIDIETWAYNVNDPYIRGITVTNPGKLNNGLPGDVLIGWFKPLDERFDGHDHSDQTYFMVTNGLTDPKGSAAQCRQRIRLNLHFGNSGINSLQRLSRQTGKVELVPLQKVPDTTARYLLELELDGGTGDLFKFNTGAPFVGSIPARQAAFS